MQENNVADGQGAAVEEERDERRQLFVSFSQMPPCVGSAAAELAQVLFPDISADWLESQVKKATDEGKDFSLYPILAEWVNNPDYVPRDKKELPYAAKKREERLRTELVEDAAPKGEFDYINDIVDLPDLLYRANADAFLKCDFSRISLNSIREVLNIYRYHYAPAYYAIKQVWKKYTTVQLDQIACSRSPYLSAQLKRSPNEPPFPVKLRVLVSRRMVTQVRDIKVDLSDAYLEEEMKQSEAKSAIPKKDSPSSKISEQFRREFVWVRKMDQYLTKKQRESANHRFELERQRRIARDMNQEETRARIRRVKLFQMANPSTEIIPECVICWQEETIDHVTPCDNGHVACNFCITAMAKEADLGYGQVPIPCADYTCTTEYSREQLIAVLPTELLAKLDVRNLEQLLAQSGVSSQMEGCKYCGTKVLVDVVSTIQKVFSCPNDECRAKICRQCNQDWDDTHIGVKCDEMCKDELGRLDRFFELERDAVAVRKCPKCSTQTVKEEGCNHIKCKCTTHFCYLCRTELNPKNPYAHFCSCEFAMRFGIEQAEIPRDVLAGCQKCHTFEVSRYKDALKLEALDKAHQIARKKLLISLPIQRRCRWDQSNVKEAAYGTQPPSPPTS